MASKNCWLNIKEVQPSQPYIDSDELENAMKEPARPIPVREIKGDTVIIDGNTRAMALLLKGKREIEVYWDNDDVDLDDKLVGVECCKRESIYNIGDLKERIIPPSEFKERWLDRREELARVARAHRANSARARKRWPDPRWL